MARIITSGFSLIEVMLITIMLVVLGAMGWPAMQKYFWQQQLYAGGEQLYAAIRDARIQAISLGQDQWFGLSQAGELCYWQTENQPHTCVADSSAASTPANTPANTPEKGVNLFRLPHDSLLLSTNFSPVPAVRFSAGNGMAGFSAGRFQLSHKMLSEQTVRVIISTLGRVRVCISGKKSHRFAAC
ncbi:hypothetical protein CWE08_11675 [Aliidiomarina iranensis]|uniref:Type II secretion system protein H n=1 Tax=Aliidiomarina iranensis TaxID=1434071 RepID=A0A432VQ86_9GAMM|nr:GspH/FimT family pseudopilin [Aliidiomarina iranensis]RUO18306.1 hypothetical protein CWE08_11675 [Aliidiomarina iranensis]